MNNFRLPALLLVVTLGCLLQPWFIPGFLTPYDFSRWIELLFLFLSLLLCLSLGVKAHLWVSPLTPLVVGSSFVVLVSASFGKADWVGWVGAGRFLIWVWLFYFYSGAFLSLSEQARCWLSRGVIGICLIYLCYTFIGFFVLFSYEVTGPDFLFSGFSNKNHAASFFLGMVLLIPAIKREAAIEPGLGKAIAGFLGVGFGLMLMIAGSRGALLSLLSALFLVGALFNGEEFRRYFREIFIFLIVALSLFLLFMFLRDLGGGGEGGMGKRNFLSDSRRFVLWDVAWRGFLQNPIFGNGPLSFPLNLDLHVAHPHNVVLLAMYEYGVLLVLLLLSCGVYLLKQIWRSRPQLRDNGVAISAMASVVAIGGHSLVGAGLMVPATLLVLLLSFSLLMSGFPGSVHGETKPCLSLGWGMKMVLAVTLSGYLFMTYLYWCELPDTGNPEPRFWQYGEIYIR